MLKIHLYASETNFQFKSLRQYNASLWKFKWHKIKSQKLKFENSDTKQILSFGNSIKKFLKTNKNPIQTVLKFFLQLNKQNIKLKKKLYYLKITEIQISSLFNFTQLYKKAQVVYKNIKTNTINQFQSESPVL